MARGQEPSQPERRGFLGKLWLGLGVVALAEGLWIALDFLRPRERQAARPAGDLLVAGPVERFATPSVTAFPQGRFYLVRLEDGGFLALSRRCTHLGCTVPWMSEQDRFVCPCHASAFDIKGNVLSPPATRALDLFAVRIENRIVKVDISRPLERQSFQIAQVTHP